MDEQIKKNVKKLARDAENKVARSILRWKYKKEGKPIPVEHQLENESRYVAEKAHQIIAKRGKTVLNELEKVYFKDDQKEEGPGE
jgi:NADH:ubiquinone oxidoreductase subunit E